MTPTPEQVSAEVSKLREMRPFVRPVSAFGDDNRGAIDAQIDVLENDLSEDAIWRRYCPDDDDGSNQSLDSALDALAWRNGVNAAPPSKDWEPLDSRKKG